MCPKRVLSLDMFWTFPWSLDMFCVTYKKCPKCGHFPFWKKPVFYVPKEVSNVWTHCGHILDTSPMFGRILCPKLQMSKMWPTWTQCVHKVSKDWTHYGHFIAVWMLFGRKQQGWTCFGHHLDTFYVLVTFLDTLWTLLGTLRPKCVRPHIVLQCLCDKTRNNQPPSHLPHDDDATRARGRSNENREWIVS